jgi:hypothetical protein
MVSAPDMAAESLVVDLFPVSEICLGYLLRTFASGVPSCIAAYRNSK